jgi:hypothetical protein
MLLKRNGKKTQSLVLTSLKQGVQEVRRFCFMDVVEKRQTVLSKKYNSIVWQHFKDFEFLRLC